MSARTWYILGGVVAVGLLLFVLGGGCASRAEVETATVTRGPIRAFLDEQAKTRLPDTHLVTMPFSGRVAAIALEEGAAVKQGQVVARLVARDVELAVEQAQAAVQRLEASIKENDDNSVEETGFKQAEQFVESSLKAVAAAWERVNSGQAMADYAQKNFDRIKRLLPGAATEDQFDQATLQRLQSGFNLEQDRLVHRSLEAMHAATNLMPTMIRQYINRKSKTGDVLKEQKAEADARLSQVLQDQQRATMTSPVDGVVLHRFLSNEQFVAAGTSLLEIGRLEDLEVEAEVLTLDIVAAKVGDAVEVYGPAIGQPPAQGKVARIFPAGFTKVSSLGVEQQRVKVIVRFEPAELKRLLADRRLGVGYHVRVRVYTDARADALTVPRAALFRSSRGQWQVFAVRDGRAQLVPVEVGLMSDESAEITAGLAEDEQVILAPESTLSGGARVRSK
jgi:HlyD family secretion protein